MIFFVASQGAQKRTTKNAIAASNPARRPAKSVVLASWYGPAFYGRRLSSGKLYRSNAVFVAHRTYPFGTRLAITDLKTMKTIVAPVEDRGPYVTGRTLDLSAQAARKLGIMRRGIAFVTYRPVKNTGIPAQNTWPTLNAHVTKFFR